MYTNFITRLNRKSHRSATPDMSRQAATLVNLALQANTQHQYARQIQLVLQEINRLLQARNSVFYLLNDVSRELWCFFMWDGEGDLHQVRLPLHGGTIEGVIRSERVLNLAAESGKLRTRLEIARAGSEPVSSTLLVPMVSRQSKLRGCLQVINKIEGRFSREDEVYLSLISDIVYLALKNNTSHTHAAAGRRLQKEISRAVEIQQQLLPGKTPDIDGYEVFAYNSPCNAVGGDYHDFFPSGNSTSFVVSDVCGKGVPAALLTANLQAYLHAFAEQSDSCREVVNRVNTHLYQFTDTSMFATFFWGKLDHREHTFRFVNAGHTPPVFVKANGMHGFLKSTGMPVGIMPDFQYGEGQWQFGSGDVLVIVSDGITDSINGARKCFGLQGLERTLRRVAALPPEKIAAHLLQAVREFTGSPAQQDDITILIIRRK